MSQALPKTNEQTLADAVARNAALVISLPSDGTLRNFRTRFLGGNEQGLWLELPQAAAELLNEIQAIQGQFVISFHASRRRLSFVTSIVQINQSFKVSDSVTTTAVQVAPATTVTATQRRSAYRVRVPADPELTVRAWTIPDHAYINDRPPASQEVRLEVRDLSVGGMGVRFPDAGHKQHKLLNDQRLRIDVKYKELEFILDARLRSAPDGEKNPLEDGIVFKELAGDLDGRQKLASLTRIVGELSQAEVRRVRLGVAV